MNKGGDEHTIQLHVGVLQNIVEPPLPAVVGDDGDTM